MRWTCTHLPLATDFNRAQKINLLCCQDPISALTRFFWHLFKSEHVRLVQYRARKQAADLSNGRLLTRAVLYQRPNVACFDLWETIINLVNVVLKSSGGGRLGDVLLAGWSYFARKTGEISRAGNNTKSSTKHPMIVTAESSPKEAIGLKFEKKKIANVAASATFA